MWTRRRPHAMWWENVVAEVKHGRRSALGDGIPRTDRFQFSSEANTSAFRTTRGSCEERGAWFKVRGGREGVLQFSVNGTTVSEAETGRPPGGCVPRPPFSGCAGLARADILQEVSAWLVLPFQKSAKAPRCLSWG